MSDILPIISSDGSTTFFSERFGETYHSRSGAIEESKHVFIENGLKRWISSTEKMSGKQVPTCNIIEYGFGTGLNTLLTMVIAANLKAGNRAIKIRYTTIEKYPITEKDIKEINYWEFLDSLCQLLGFPEVCGYPWEELFKTLHSSPWNQETIISECFTLIKILGDFNDYHPTESIDVVYYDAFSPVAQPELWSADIFSRISANMNPGAIFATYSSKGTVKESLRSAGLKVERLPGYGSKRHMVIATKL